MRLAPAALLLAAACARDPAPGLARDETLLQLVGTGRVETRPDRARISIGVTTGAETARAALDLNAQTMTRVLQAIEAAGVPAKDTRTETLSNSRSWYTGKRRRFESQNRATLIVRDLSRVGAVVAAANEAGANEVSGPIFELADPDAPARRARAAALADARAQADAYARALGKRVIRILRVSELDIPDPAPSGVYADSVARFSPQEAAPPPVRSGSDTTALRTRVDLVLAPA